MRNLNQVKANREAVRGRILIVTGTPGTGKTTVSKILASKIGARIISIGTLVEKERLHVDLDREGKTLVADMERVAERVREIVSGNGGAFILEGHYAMYVVQPADVGLAFVLRRDPKELKGVLAKRNYGEGKVRENVAAEILDVCLCDALNQFGLDKVCEVEVTGREVEDVVDEILLIFEGKRRPIVGVVDWLGKLESEGELDYYLKW